MVSVIPLSAANTFDFGENHRDPQELWPDRNNPRDDRFEHTPYTKTISALQEKKSLIKKPGGLIGAPGYRKGVRLMPLVY